MSSLFSGQYAGFIFSAYAITFVVVLLLVIWVLATGKARKRQLAKLEEAGYSRAAAQSDKV